MYLETMEKVLADIDKVIIDKESGSGVVPYLPLPELKKSGSNKLMRLGKNFNSSDCSCRNSYIPIFVYSSRN